MDVETLHKYRREEPFRPIRFHFADGESMDVRYANLLLVTTEKVMIGIPSPAHPELPHIYKTFKLVHPDQIVSVELLNELSTSAS